MVKSGRFVLLMVVVAAALAAFAGCGSDDEGSPSTTAEAPTRGFNVADQIKSSCKAIGGNFDKARTVCVFDSGVTCVNNKITGAAKLNGFFCAIDPKLKAALDKYDADAGLREQQELLAALKREKEDCEAKGSPYEWLEGANYCIRTK